MKGWDAHVGVKTTTIKFSNSSLVHPLKTMGFSSEVPSASGPWGRENMSLNT